MSCGKGACAHSSGVGNLSIRRGRWCIAVVESFQCGERRGVAWNLWRYIDGREGAFGWEARVICWLVLPPIRGEGGGRRCVTTSLLIPNAKRSSNGCAGSASLGLVSLNLGSYFESFN